MSFSLLCLESYVKFNNSIVFIASLRGLDGPVVRPLAARAKSSGFDLPIAQHVQRLISRAFAYGAVGSLVLSWS